MLAIQILKTNTYTHALRPQFRLKKSFKQNVATFHSSAHLPQNDGPAYASSEGDTANEKAGPNRGAMSRRLSEMTEENIESGGRSARKVIHEAGFSEELKKRLEAKIEDSNFRNENPTAFAQLDMPV